MNGANIIRAIWKHNDPEGKLWHFQATQSRPSRVWSEVPREPGEGPEILSPPGGEPFDTYFAPLGFTTERRSNETAAGFAVLFADIDDGKKPSNASFIWETSPGNLQAVWLLEQALPDYSTWADLNQRLTYYLDADKGGWMGSKVLRVPGSTNHKRGGVLGEVLQARPTPLWPIAMFTGLPEVRGRESIPAMPLPEPWSKEESMRRALELPLSLRSFLFKRNVRDRSDHIIRTINEFKRQGISDEDTFRLIWHRPWNKFSSRPMTLWSQIKV